MKILFSFVLFILISPSTLIAQDRIGLYFDTGAASCCSEVFYAPVDLYAIVENFSHPDSLAGWEFRVESDPGIYISINEIYGDAMNVGEWPDLIVGLAEPLINYGNYVLLAKFSVLAMNEGDIFILPAIQSSVPDSNKPICLVHGIQSLIEMNVNMPEEISGQAGFRDSSPQPIFPESPRISEYGIEGAQPFVLDSGKVVDSRKFECEPNVTINFEALMHDSDVGFIGQVEDVRYECLYIPGFGAQSLAFVKFMILESYWGGVRNSFIIDVKVNRPENCVEYSSPHFSTFSPGEQYFVAARVLENRAKVLPCGIWLFRENSLQSPGGHLVSSPVSELLNQVASTRDITNQIAKADYIGLVKIETMQGERNNRVAVAKVERNIYAPDFQNEYINFLFSGNLSDVAKPIVVAPGLIQGQEYLVLLSRNQNGDFTPVSGVHSCLKFEGGRLEMARGIEWGPLRLFEETVRGIR